MLTETENKNKKEYQHALDHICKYDKEYGYMFIDNGLTLAASRKTIIIPSDKVLAEIKKIKTQKERKHELLKYILRTPPKFKSALEKIKTGEGYILTMYPNYYYNISKKNSKYYLNKIEIEVIDEMKDGRTAILKAKKKLIPIEYVKPKSKQTELKVKPSISTSGAGKLKLKSNKKYKIGGNKKYKIGTPKTKSKTGGSKKDIKHKKNKKKKIVTVYF